MLSTVGNAILAGSILAALALPQNVAVFRSNADLVVVSCAVVDANGLAAADLARDDFRVFDNGARRTVENFAIDTDLPLTVGVLIDATESQKEALTEHRKTTAELLGRILRPGDRSFVITIDGDVSGSSPLWNAVYDAAQLNLHDVKGNKALLLLTDGFDSGSLRTWNQAADAAHKADAAVYAIQYPSAFGRKFAADLYKLTAATGGTWFDAPKGDYDRIVSRIETDLRRRYVLGFRPDRLSGKMRRDVRVEVTRSDLTVRASKTYFEEAR